MSATAPSLSCLRVDLESVVVNDYLVSRPLRKAERRAEREALSALTDTLPQGRLATLKCLANLALSLCDAGTAGVSVLDGDMFRWQALAGKLAALEGGTTPRHDSPCGTCLDAGKPMLYSWPARRFTYFEQIDTPIVEGLVIPVYANGVGVATIWIVSHDGERTFDAEDVRLMTSLAKFAGAALSSEMSTTWRSRAEQESPAEREVVWAGYLRRIARNDATALAGLFHEASPLAFATALRILGFPADADEVAGDVFSRIWNRAYTYDPARGSATGWILTIARNLSFERLRMRAPEQQWTDRSQFDRHLSQDPESVLFMTQSDRDLRKALAALPCDQRQAIELAYFSELSHMEIAHLLSEPLGTVKTRIRLGMVRLRTSLAATAKRI